MAFCCTCKGVKKSIIPSVASRELVHLHLRHTLFVCIAYYDFRSDTIITSVDGSIMRRSPARDARVRYLKLCTAQVGWCGPWMSYSKNYLFLNSVSASQV